MDADDISLPERIRLQVEFLQQHPDVSIVGTWCIEFTTPGVPMFQKELPTSDEEVKKFMLYRSPLIHPTVRVGYVACPQSAFRGVNKLQPGSVLTFASPHDIGTTTVYWSLPASVSRDRVPMSTQDDEAMLSDLEHLLDRSIRQQMLSDVPLGAFLSGGIDSSLIVALMQRASSQRVRTFSMGVREQGEDESKHARRVSGMCL